MTPPTPEPVRLDGDDTDYVVAKRQDDGGLRLIHAYVCGNTRCIDGLRLSPVAVANLRALLAPDARGGVEGLRDALDNVWAAIGDRLLAKGPLAKPYAHGITDRINVALASARAYLAATAPGDAPATGTGEAT